MWHMTSHMPLTFLDNVVRLGSPFDFGQNAVGRGGPNEGLGISVVQVNVVGDGALQFGDAAEDAATEPSLSQVAEPAFYQVQPRGRGGNEVKVEARMVSPPSFDPWMFMRAVIVEDEMQLQLRRRFLVDLLHKSQELLMPMTSLAAFQNRAFEHIQGGK